MPYMSRCRKCWEAKIPWAYSRQHCADCKGRDELRANVQPVRTWTLVDLDRETVYRLWFDPAVNRWEVRPEGQESGTVVTRNPVPRRLRGPQRVGAPAPSDGGASAEVQENANAGLLPAQLGEHSAN
jgi:hypothetical protein